MPIDPKISRERFIAEMEAMNKFPLSFPDTAPKNPFAMSERGIAREFANKWVNQQQPWNNWLNDTRLGLSLDGGGPSYPGVPESGPFNGPQWQDAPTNIGAGGRGEVRHMIYDNFAHQYKPMTYDEMLAYHEKWDPI